MFFVRNNCIVICYVDDCCILSKDKGTIDAVLTNLSKTFKLTDQGGIKSYLGMNVIKDSNGTTTISQPANVILTKDEDVNGRKQECNQCSVIGHEYISLIQIVRDLIPLRYIMLELPSVFWIKCKSQNSYTTTFEGKKEKLSQQKNQDKGLKQNIFPSNGIILESISNEAHQRQSLLK